MVRARTGQAVPFPPRAQHAPEHGQHRYQWCGCKKSQQPTTQGKGNAKPQSVVPQLGPSGPLNAGSWIDVEEHLGLYEHEGCKPKQANVIMLPQKQE